MQPKPESFGTNYAEEFQKQQVVDAYRYRPPYPPEVFAILAQLITDEPRAVLDVGAGSGDIARQFIDSVERIDAVDPSLNMLARGKELPNGKHPHLNWIYGTVEEVSLTPPYALITAGSSIHWTDWPVAFPRFRSLLTPHGYLAVVYRHVQPMPWDSDLRKLHAQFSAHRARRPNTIKELERRGFFRPQGTKETTSMPFMQSIDDFIDGLHSRSSFSRERMGYQQATDFDQQARELLLHYSPDGILPLHVVATVTWGIPENGTTNLNTQPSTGLSVPIPDVSVTPLIALSRTWVSENYGRRAQHLLKAEEWLRRINPSATEAMLLAALTHDMERAFPGPDSPKQDPSLGPDDPIYNQAHSKRSARIVSAFLQEQQVPEALVTEIASLIEVHEIGGWPEADWVQAADSLSFLEVNIEFFLDRAPEMGWTLEQIRAKFDWMYERIKQPEARALATPLYEVALQKWKDQASL